MFTRSTNATKYSSIRNGTIRQATLIRERLKEFDLSKAQIERLHGPAGIYIGSRSPPEIAIFILAEVTAAKNCVRLREGLRIERAKETIEIGYATTVSSSRST
jgi:xanthine dehydrogenase accessory factor